MYEGNRHSPVITAVENYLTSKTYITQSEEIPVHPNERITKGPYLKRYFLKLEFRVSP